MWAAILAGLKSVASTMANAGTAAAANSAGAAAGAGSTVAGATGTALESAAANSATGGIGAAVRGGVGAAANGATASSLGNIVGEVGQNIGAEAAAPAVNAPTAVEFAKSEALNNTQNLSQDLWDGAKNMAQEAWGGVKNFAQDAWDGGYDSLTGKSGVVARGADGEIQWGKTLARTGGALVANRVVNRLKKRVLPGTALSMIAGGKKYE